ncbi:O52D1 protein, partial [Amia calva]|nr:O52D1 protein [Amia calva]
MQNTSNVTQFFLTAYSVNGNIRYLYFIISLVGYLLIIFANTVVITVITRNRKLHEPMYIFICNLALNGLYGSCAFFPQFIGNLLSEQPTISKIGCYIQIFSVHTYGLLEYSILALMAYDRYLSICHPLRYNSILTPSKLTQLLVFVYMYPVCIFSIHLCLTVRLPLCGSVIDKVYCDNWSVVKLSCVDITVNSIFGNFVTIILMVPPLVVVIFSYVRIFDVCLKATKEARAKALETCAPHLLTLTNYYIATFFEVTHHRFDVSKMPHVLRVFMSIDFLLLPPLLNPIIYGVKMQEIKKRTLQMFSAKTNSVDASQGKKQKKTCLSERR